MRQALRWVGGATPALLAVVTACTLTSGGRTGSSGPTEGQLITREQIQAADLSTGWEVLRHYAKHLSLQESPHRGPTRVTRRGRTSIYLREDPLLVLDGVRMRDYRLLGTLPARDIESLRILDALQGTSRFGPDAASGAIVVVTRRSK